MRGALLIVLVLLGAMVARPVMAIVHVDINEELDRIKELGMPEDRGKVVPGLKEDIDGILAGRILPQRIPNAKYRIAVF